MLWLGEAACHDPALTGGKASRLSQLAAHYTVPPGFCLTVAAYGRWHRPGSDGPPPAELAAAVSRAYQRLAELTGTAWTPLFHTAAAVITDTGSP